MERSSLPVTLNSALSSQNSGDWKIPRRWFRRPTSRANSLDFRMECRRKSLIVDWPSSDRLSLRRSLPVGTLRSTPRKDPDVSAIQQAVNKSDDATVAIEMNEGLPTGGRVRYSLWMPSQAG